MDRRPIMLGRVQQYSNAPIQRADRSDLIRPLLSNRIGIPSGCVCRGDFSLAYADYRVGRISRYLVLVFQVSCGGFAISCLNIKWHHCAARRVVLFRTRTDQRKFLCGVVALRLLA